MNGIITLTDAELDAVSGGQAGNGGNGGNGRRGGDALAASVAAILVEGDVDDSPLTATSGDATATGGAGGGGGAGGPGGAG